VARGAETLAAQLSHEQENGAQFGTPRRTICADLRDISHAPRLSPRCPRGQNGSAF
jgi:hypothetical protein